MVTYFLRFPHHPQLFAFPTLLPGYLFSPHYLYVFPRFLLVGSRFSGARQRFYFVGPEIWLANRRPVWLCYYFLNDSFWIIVGLILRLLHVHAEPTTNQRKTNQNKTEQQHWKYIERSTYFGTETARIAKFLEVPSCNNVCSSWKGGNKEYIV